MGGNQHFGKLAFVRNIISIQLSPFEQQICPHAVHAFFNVITRWAGQNVPYMAGPFIGGYLLYRWGKAENQRLSRKNPAHYVNDV